MIRRLQGMALACATHLPRAPAVQLKAKITLLAVVPLLLSLLLIGVAMFDQQLTLGHQTRALVREAYMEARRAELRHNMDLALSALQSVRTTPGQDGTADATLPADDATQQRRALHALGRMNYGPDGYFFVYDQHGTVLMHSRQPELMGRNLWNLIDDDGQPTIQLLLAKARAGGGFIEFPWRKPSSGQTVPKLGYVTLLQPWGWMIGTGLYLDDIQQTLSALDEGMDRNIRTTIGWLMAVAAGGTVVISISGLMLNLSEHREADAQLRLMARRVVQSQEDERARLARELHDGTSQTLVAGKLLIESAVDELHRQGQPHPAALDKALSRLNDALLEVRHLSHSLRPAMLDNLGLPAALAHLGREFGEHTGLRIDTHIDGTEIALPDEVNTVLFRVAQEALTNVAKHARASQVDLSLSFEPEQIELRINDNGAGFDPDALRALPREGIGLRNMRERLAAIGGRFDVHADVARHPQDPHHGTLVLATVPVRVLARLPSLQSLQPPPSA